MENKQEKTAPIKKKKKPMKMMDIVLYALLFVFAWTTYSQFVVFGLDVVIHAVLKLVVACVTGWLTHVAFYGMIDWREGKTFTSFWKRITANHKKIVRNVPLITAVILSIRFRSDTPLLIIILSVVLAELIGKLMWGGFGKNIVNPVAVGFLLTDLMFEQYNRMPQAVDGMATLIDGVTSATPLTGIASNGWYFGSYQYAHFQAAFGNWWTLLIGHAPAPSAEMARLAILIAFAFMAYKKALDWVIPVLYLGTVFVITTVIGFYHGFSLVYPLYHLLTGGLLFGAVFMATDPVTIPKNKPGKMIFAILLGVLTLAIRFGSLRFPEGMMLALVVMNLLSPWLNQKAAPLAKKTPKVRLMTYGTIFIAGLLFVVLVSALNTGV
ncbi:MAG: RnfABCDGE type electron transport complex subunit D [Defluviitaleaceae bacterium]|nr:RnfABCDGE type electron transport complex subunit D [Defluviitaleaceae bacterium]